MKADQRISIKDYLGNKNLKILFFVPFLPSASSMRTSFTKLLPDIFKNSIEVLNFAVLCSPKESGKVLYTGVAHN